MLRKILLLGAVMAFALAGAVSAQAAGITGTAHEINLTGGSCATCHLPHGAQGKRLWVAGTNASTSVVGDVSMLCSYCHLTAGGAPATVTNGTMSRSDSFVYGGLSHGYLMSKLTATAQPNDMTWSELPYHKAAGGGNIGRIECTTCHDVHNNDVGKRPFLRMDINLLCASCHGTRQRAGAAWQSGNLQTATFGAWTKPTNIGLGNPGSHPVGTDITGDGNPDAPITIWRSMKIGFTGTKNNWVTGGHLSSGNTGALTCLTCHAVHGIRNDADPTGDVTIANENIADKTEPVSNMLVIAQGLAQDQNARNVANGQGGYNGLCEACHVGNNTQMAGAYNVTATGSTATTPKVFVNPNPGATPYGHPVDGMRVTGGRDWVPNGATWPTLNLFWPVGNSAATSASNPNVICESCHVPHAAANSGRRDLTTAPAMGLTTDYMLRGLAGDVCWACHTNSLKSHHPVNKTYNTAGVTYLSSIGGAVANQTLECGTCHGTTGAHNWSGKGQVGLDAQWKPINNGRGAQADEMFVTTASLTCMDCHTGMLGVAKGNRSPTLHAVLSTTYSGPKYQATAEAYNTIGYGSHALGKMGGATNPIRKTYTAGAASYWTSLGSRRTNHFSTTNAGWSATFGGVGGYSRFGGTAAAPVLVCESCHELQPGKNANTHLLLGQYVEEPAVTASQDRSWFCEGCHNPTGTHQMTGMTVTRTNAILSTDPAAAWLVTPTDTTNIKITNNNKMNCDTCHQPHDANTPSATFILDVNRASVEFTNSAAVANAGVWGSYSGYWPTIQQNKGGNHNKFCQQCHNY